MSHLQWIELSSGALAQNIRQFKKRIKKNTRVAALLKANAYGHGLLPMAELFQTHGLDYFCVHHPYEAFEMVQLGHQQTPLLLLGPYQENDLVYLSDHGIEILVSNPFQAGMIKRFLKKHAKPLTIHLKIETGTYRQGLYIRELPSILSILKSDLVTLKGVSTHFANTEDTEDPGYYRKQLSTFQESLTWLKKHAFTPPLIHCACSSAVLLHPESQFTMIRPGISLFGYYSSPEVQFALGKRFPLRPVLSWKTRLTSVKWVDKGEFVGYGLTFHTNRKTRLGIIPVGYSDGYDRLFSNKGYVLVKDTFAPVIGRVCMNFTLLDLTDVPTCKEGDEVILIGEDKTLKITASTLASWGNTIAYEILSRLNPHIPRLIVP